MLTPHPHLVPQLIFTHVSFFFLPCPDFVRILIEMFRGFGESLEIGGHCIYISFKRSTVVMNRMPNRGTYPEEPVAKLLP
jgi:hypothetical protein